MVVVEGANVIFFISEDKYFFIPGNSLISHEESLSHIFIVARFQGVGRAAGPV